MPRRISRRSFLTSTAAATALVAAPSIIPSSARGADGAVAPSNRITMGFIGLGGRGTVNFNTFLGRAEVQVVALCDVDAGSRRYEDEWYRGLAPAMQAATERYASQSPTGQFAGIKGYNDFRELLARNDVDAVCISTPDHWHCAIAVMAARAGKDIYCEKPLSHNIAEGRAVADAVARYARIFQCGSQRRASARCRQACELVRNGRIGKLQSVHVGLMGPYWIRKNAKKTHEPEPVPEGFDYDLWLGPAPAAPYTYNRCHWNFRWHLDYASGNLTDWGAHYIDMAHWGMDTERTGPVEVEGKGTFPPVTDPWNAPTQFHVTCTYANGVKLTIESGGPACRFEGTEGWLDLEGQGSKPSIRRESLTPGEPRLYESNDHHGNFLDCVKSRRPAAAEAEVAHRSITPAHLGMIAMRLGRKLQWDPQKERFLNDPEADRLIGRTHRAPWTV